MSFFSGNIEVAKLLKIAKNNSGNYFRNNFVSEGRKFPGSGLNKL